MPISFLGRSASVVFHVVIREVTCGAALCLSHVLETLNLRSAGAGIVELPCLIIYIYIYVLFMSVGFKGDLSLLETYVYFFVFFPPGLRQMEVFVFSSLDLNGNSEFLADC